MKARRATFEDLPQLLALWTLERLDAADLEKRFTEFQVAEKDGEIVGAMALHISSHHGFLHSESIGRADIGDEVRQMLWERMKIVARNHSLDRIWMAPGVAFWRKIGFAAATEEQTAKVPKDFGIKPAWEILLLRGEEASADAIQKQFAMLHALQVEEREKLQRQVAVMKKLAIGVTAAVAVLVIVWAIVVFKYGPRFMNR